jgi:hypothetical protein
MKTTTFLIFLVNRSRSLQKEKSLDFEIGTKTE